MYRIYWSYKPNEPLLNAKSFKVYATPEVTDTEGTQLLPIPFPVNDPNLRSTEIELELGTSYSISVETHFNSRGLQPQRSKENKTIITPTYNHGNRNIYIVIDVKTIGQVLHSVLIDSFISPYTVKPIINVPEDSVTQFSATTIITEPEILRECKRHACEGLKLTGVKYSIAEPQQQDGGDGPNSKHGKQKDGFNDFKE